MNFTFSQAENKPIHAYTSAAIAEGTSYGAVIDQHDTTAIGGGNGQYQEGVLTMFSGAIANTPTATEVTLGLQHRKTTEDAWEDVTDPGLVESGVKITAASQVVQMGFRPRDLKRYIRAKVVTDFTDGSSPTIVLSGHYTLSVPNRI